MQNFANKILEACYHNDLEISEYARTASKYIIERSLVEGDEEYYQDLELHIHFFIKKAKILDQSVAKSEVYWNDLALSLVDSFLQAFKNQPENRLWISWVLKYSGTLDAVREYFINYIKLYWPQDEKVASNILDILWDIENFRALESLYYEIAVNAKNEELSQWCKDVIKVSNQILYPQRT
ncbi:hypothetical protein [Psychrobacter sp. I-STPA10]|uniref:hypothetical protein n=1 Tax=Psychrobacter sp. I-STPA10 TaxID=2585769 RepID=UPI001E2B4F1E|nr:hypothetical protein [Psychrobacter sp. I-STPA10]